MSLAEGVSRSIVYKAYSTGVITSNTQPVSTADPAVGSAQVLRRVASTLNLSKDTYQSAEIRQDRQIADFRHGVKRVQGNISGELSPNSYSDFMEASLRGTWTALVVAGPSDFTSMSASNVSSQFSATSGNPVTKGFRVGDIIRFTNMADTDNNAKNFVITGFSGTSNRDIGVYPAPDTMSPDASFSVTTVSSVYAPATNHVSRKFGIEVVSSDIDVSQLFTECRATGFSFAMPATGMSTCEFMFMGRDMETYTGGSSPFYTSPTAVTTTGLFTAVNGLMRLQGTTVGVVTGINMSLNLNPSADPVIGQNFVPEIFLGRVNVTGQMTAHLEDLTLVNYFKNETEVEVLVYLTTTSAVNSPAMTIYLPRVKFGGADIATSGEGSQAITGPFQALKYETAVATDGVENTTIRICDTEVTP